MWSVDANIEIASNAVPHFQNLLMHVELLSKKDDLYLQCLKKKKLFVRSKKYFRVINKIN